MKKYGKNQPKPAVNYEKITVADLTSRGFNARVIQLGGNKAAVIFTKPAKSETEKDIETFRILRVNVIPEELLLGFQKYVDGF